MQRSHFLRMVGVTPSPSLRTHNHKFCNRKIGKTADQSGGKRPKPKLLIGTHLNNFVVSKPPSCQPSVDSKKRRRSHVQKAVDDEDPGLTISTCYRLDVSQDDVCQRGGHRYPFRLQLGLVP